MPINNPPATPTVSEYGTYVGNNAANRAVAHGLGSIPSLVVIWPENADFFFRIIRGNAKVVRIGATSGSHGVSAQTDTNFYVGNAADYEQSANYTGRNYFYVAIS
ncbi:hypothetical protein ES703_70983 [subsurface metagenome]